MLFLPRFQKSLPIVGSWTGVTATGLSMATSLLRDCDEDASSFVMAEVMSAI